jgi:hypothetical protein
MPGMARWAPGPVWTGVENFALTCISYQDRPTRIQSLKQLSYLAMCRLLQTSSTYVGHTTISSEPNLHSDN